MDHSIHLVSVFGLDRDTVTVSAHGDDRILQIGAQRSVDKIRQRRVHLIIQGANAAADTLQSTAGIVADLVLPLDTAFNLCGKRRQRFQLFKIHIQAVRQIILCIVAPV